MRRYDEMEVMGLDFQEKQETKENKISLAGRWSCRLDETDVGEEEAWYEKNVGLIDVNLPGTLCENRIGKPLDMSLDLTPDSVRSFQAAYEYIGKCWYQRKIEIPKSWNQKHIILSMERLIMTSSVWIEGEYVGMHASLVGPHVYELPFWVQAGHTYLLTVCVDNRDPYFLGRYGNSYTGETQTIWNGIIGDIFLEARPQIFFDKIQLISSYEEKFLKIMFKISNFLGEGIKGKIEYKIYDPDTHELIKETYSTHEIETGDKVLQNVIALPKTIIGWSEFSPKLYEICIRLSSFDEDKNQLSISKDRDIIQETMKDQSIDEKWMTFGVRELRVYNNHIYINQHRLFLRGNLENCIHPLTGYPPCDFNYWLKLLQKVKSYGMNHLRFHSNCPPKAAFEAADRLGMYFQIEGPIWLDEWFIPFGSHPQHYEFLPKEIMSIIENYGNHPSFCILSNGNELRGDFGLMHDMIAEARKRRPDLLYTLTSNYDRPLDPEDDLFISVEVDKKGMRGNRFYPSMAMTLSTDYREAVQSRNIPLIAHETGQYCVYPDITEIPIYDGNLVPVNLMAIRKDLEKRDMLGEVARFVQASGVFAARLYKEEIETYMRTIDYAGYQMLGLQDFPGQCTATIGLLNAFWESKGLVSKAEFKKSCNEVTLLCNINQRVFSTEDVLKGYIIVDQFSSQDLMNQTIIWTLKDETGHSLYRGKWEGIDLQAGSQIILGCLPSISFETYRHPAELHLHVSITNSPWENEWRLWVFPTILESRLEEMIEKSDVHIVDSWNEEIEEKLVNGEKVLILPTREAFTYRKIYETDYYPVFWSPVFFDAKKPCGIDCKYPDLFGNFPTDRFADAQWYHLLTESFCIDLDFLGHAKHSLIDGIPNYYYNHRLSNLILANVGQGTLMVCTMLHENSRKTSEGQWFLYSLLEILSKSLKESRRKQTNFEFEVEGMSIEDARRLFVGKPEDMEIEKKVSREGFIG